MPEHKYVARDPKTGKKVEGVIQAADERAVSAYVKSQGLALIEVSVSGSDGILGKFNSRVSSKDKVVFSRQLSTLIDAGLPLVQSLRSVLDQTKSKPLQAVLLQVINEVEGGVAFSAALGKHPRVFDPIFVSLVEAGEVSGTLDVALDRIANQQEKDAELVSKVRGAMIYPIIVLLVMVAVVVFMLVSVLPQVESLYDGIPGARLPLLTRVLLTMSNFLTDYWFFVILVIIGLIFLGSRWARTLGGVEIVDKLKMRVWPIGPLFVKMYMARFSRTGTTLVASGVPLIQVLNIVSNAVNNVHVERSINKATEKVRGGKSLSSSLKDDPNFLDLVPQMIKIGEDSGSLEGMLDKTADYFEKEVDNQVKAISTIIEPLLMIILGIVAITIVAAILLPIYGLVGQNFIR